MSKYYTVTLPVKPYIKKYVETIEGPQLQYKSTSMLCRIIRAYLENKSYSGLSASQKEAALSLRTTSIEILVPMNKQYAIGTTLHADGVLQANAFLQDCFERAIKNYMEDSVLKDGRYKGYKEAIEGFAKQYNIELESDISFDGLKKLEYRFRKSRRKNISKNVPSAW